MSLTPMGDGSIPPREKEICAEIGKWLRVNGDAIYGTRMWKIATEGPLGTFKHKPEKRVVYWDYRDKSKQGQIRFTQRGDYMYAIFLDWPKDAFVVRSLGKGTIPNAEIESIELLGYAGALKYKQTNDVLVIELPEQKPNEYAFAFKIKLNGDIGDIIIASKAYTMEEEYMSYEDILEKHSR